MRRREGQNLPVPTSLLQNWSVEYTVRALDADADAGDADGTIQTYEILGRITRKEPGVGVTIKQDKQPSGSWSDGEGKIPKPYLRTENINLTRDFTLWPQLQ